jgi:hypothetical protein
MTPLPAVVGKAGLELSLIRRVGRAAIYRQHLPGGNPDHDAYEVILPQVRNTDYKGERVEAYEGYPVAESWGKKGWTFISLAKAVQKLKEVAQKASCGGTASRRNRLNRRAGITSRPTANGSRLRAAISLAKAVRLGRSGRVMFSQLTPIQRNHL